MFIAIWNSFFFLLIVFVLFTTCAIPLRPAYKHHLILFTSFIFHIFSLIKAIVSRKALCAWIGLIIIYEVLFYCQCLYTVLPRTLLQTQIRLTIMYNNTFSLIFIWYMFICRLQLCKLLLEENVYLFNVGKRELCFIKYELWITIFLIKYFSKWEASLSLYILLAYVWKDWDIRRYQ